MGGFGRLLLTVVAVVALMAAGGCGGGSESTSGSDAKQGEKEAKVDWSIYPPGPTRQFIVPGKDNAVQTFGWEATAAERKQATDLIARWMRARAATDWAKDCSYFSRGYAREITEDAHSVSHGKEKVKSYAAGKQKSCAEALAYFGEEASGDYRNTFGKGPVASLRIDTTHGYAQYHGNDGKDYVVPVALEGGKWRISNTRPFGRFE
jgi:hypothetical protein